MMRHKIVAGNWKMHKNITEAKDLVWNLVHELHGKKLRGEIIIAPPALYLYPLKQITQLNTKIKLAAQNCNENTQGAFTGEYAATMLHSLGVRYVILGHSERRTLFNETNAQIKQKVQAALDAGVKVIWCCGESLEQRENNEQEAHILHQLETNIFHLTETQLHNITIAYEPIWAIGTGKTASPEQAQEMHAFIRKKVAEKYGNTAAERIHILYGGSCNAENAAALFSKKDIDGGLIGGASLKIETFLPIVAQIYE